jgi:protein TonB
MEKKKSFEANIDNQRSSIILVAALFVGGLTLASFSYKSVTDFDEFVKKNDHGVEIKFEQIAKVDPPEIKPQIETVVPPSTNIIIDSNTQKVPDPVVILDPPDIEISDTTIKIVKPPIVDFPDMEASYPGGAVEMNKFINKYITYPQTSIEIGDQGIVYLNFVVELDGSLSEIKIERGVSKELDREAKRVVRKMPNWNPGETEGKKVRTRCRLPIVFELE